MMTISGITPAISPLIKPADSHRHASQPAPADTKPGAIPQDVPGKTLPHRPSNAQQASGQTSANTSQNGSFSEEERRQVAELKARDQQVRAHEAAHKNAAGGLAQGSASFTYTTGPDGKRYAVGGEVSIDTAKVEGDPEATIEKAQRIRAAALAPAQPSSQDMAIAAKAAQMAVQARAELLAEKRESEDPSQTTAIDMQGNGINAYTQTQRQANDSASSGQGLVLSV